MQLPKTSQNCKAVSGTFWAVLAQLKSEQDFVGDQHPDPGPDSRIFYHHLEIVQKSLSTGLQKKILTDLPEISRED